MASCDNPFEKLHKPKTKFGNYILYQLKLCKVTVIFFRKIYLSCEILHKVSEKFSEVSENRTKLNKPTSKMPHVALNVVLNCRPPPSTLGSFHNFGATSGNLCQFLLLWSTSDIFPCDMGPHKRPIISQNCTNFPQISLQKAKFPSR